MVSGRDALARTGAVYIVARSKSMTIDRRSFLKYAGLVPLISAVPRLAFAAAQTTPEKPDYTLRIGTGLVELAPDHIVSTTLYNGQFPGPLLQFKEGQPVIVDVHNDTDTPELVHWHGQMIPSDVDGAAEEGTPFVPAHEMRRISFVPRPSGFRFYHTHVVAGADLNRGTYTGQAGPVYIEPKDNAGAYDREIFLVMKEFEPAFSHGGDMALDALAGAPAKELQQIGRGADEEAEEKNQGLRGGLRTVRDQRPDGNACLAEPQAGCPLSTTTGLRRIGHTGPTPSSIKKAPRHHTKFRRGDARFLPSTEIHQAQDRAIERFHVERKTKGTAVLTNYNLSVNNCYCLTVAIRLCADVSRVRPVSTPLPTTSLAPVPQASRSSASGSFWQRRG
jgi:hypothetical protein